MNIDLVDIMKHNDDESKAINQLIDESDRVDEFDQRSTFERNRLPVSKSSLPPRFKLIQSTTKFLRMSKMPGHESLVASGTKIASVIERVRSISKSDKQLETTKPVERKSNQQLPSVFSRDRWSTLAV